MIFRLGFSTQRVLAMMILWPILWLVLMFSMVVAVIVAAIMEQKARARAAAVVREQMAAMQQAHSQPVATSAPSDNGFGATGTPDFGAFDDFK